MYSRHSKCSAVLQAGFWHRSHRHSYIDELAIVASCCTGKTPQRLHRRYINSPAHAARCHADRTVGSMLDDAVAVAAPLEQSTPEARASTDDTLASYDDHKAALHSTDEAYSAVEATIP